MPWNWAWFKAEHAVARTGRNKVWLAARYAVSRTARSGAPRVTRHAATSAIVALVAYDDADQYLDMTSDQLKLWAALTESPAAELMWGHVNVWRKHNRFALDLTIKDPPLDRVSKSCYN